ncbi:hypothetical protein AB5I41_10600 [Sphingomonas sp. MMS24-JH45]
MLWRAPSNPNRAFGDTSIKSRTSFFAISSQYDIVIFRSPSMIVSERCSSRANGVDRLASLAASRAARLWDCRRAGIAHLTFLDLARVVLDLGLRTIVVVTHPPRLALTPRGAFLVVAIAPRQPPAAHTIILIASVNVPHVPH